MSNTGRVKKNPLIFSTFMANEWFISSPQRVPHLISPSSLWPVDSAILEAAKKWKSSSQKWMTSSSFVLEVPLPWVIRLSLSPLSHDSFCLRSISVPSPQQNYSYPVYMFGNDFVMRRKLHCTSCSKTFLHVHTDHLSSSPKIASCSNSHSAMPFSHWTSLFSAPLASRLSWFSPSAIRKTRSDHVTYTQGRPDSTTVHKMLH